MSHITNIVVVMLENRSYDNVLGLLYNPGNASGYVTPPVGQADVDGLSVPFANASNVDAATGLPIGVWSNPNDPASIPNIDPGEPFYDMAHQFLGVATAGGTDPYANAAAGTVFPMSGFVDNYRSVLSGCSNIAQVGALLATPSINSPDDVRNIMHCYAPATMPVTAYLANNFMVCDSWFASAPTQTFANRMFAHCSQPGGAENLFKKMESFIDDSQYIAGGAWGNGLAVYSIFEQLDATFGTRQTNWKVYSHDYSITANLIAYVKNAAAAQGNLASFDGSDYADAAVTPFNATTTFLQDAAAGKLPKYSFIEPRYSNTYKSGNLVARPGLPVNSNHPGSANYSANIVPNNPPISVADGEMLLLTIYQALLNSPQWSGTLLIITYDEHGGLFDHVSPPIVPAATVTAAAIPPTSSLLYGSFAFSVLGGRVPAIVVSPFVVQGSRLTAAGPFDHTSIVRTVWDAFNLGVNRNDSSAGEGLNARDISAPSVLAGVLPIVVTRPPNPPSMSNPPW